jgi:hypothetical protein
VSAPMEKRDQRREDPNRELMRVLGGKGYTALPPDQHKWQQRADIEDNSELHRLWSWVIDHICFFGHTLDRDGHPKAYATDRNGTELYLDHAAADLKMDLANVYRAWRKGVGIGLWRNGTKEEGKRRLYLLARVAAPEGQSEGDEIVCTDNFPPCLGKLPPYMQEQLAQLPAEKLQEAAAWYAKLLEVGSVSLAEVVATHRMVLGDIEYTGWEQFGIEKNRNGEHRPKDADEEWEREQQARRARIAALRPHVQLSVQTILTAVQTPEEPVYKENSDAVQANSRGPSLLQLPSISSQQRACVRDSSSGDVSGSVPSNDGKEAGYVPAAEKPTGAAETKVAAGLMAMVRELQIDCPKKFGGELVDPKSKRDQKWSLNIVQKTAMQFDELSGAQQLLERKAAKRAMGHALTPALISEILISDFPAPVDRARDREGAAAEQERQRRAQEERDARNERELQTYDQMEDRWQRMDNEERSKRLAVEEAKLKATPDWIKRWLHDKKARHAEMENRAKSTLRREIEQSQVQAGGAS